MYTRIEIDTQKMATEVEQFLDKKKFDLVDYSYPAVLQNQRTPRPECYLPPLSEEYPETMKMSKQWLDFFDAIGGPINAAPEEPGDTTLEKMLEKYCPELAIEYTWLNQLVSEVLEKINKDTKFWETLRAAILPLYDKSREYDNWKERWNSLELIYDPTPLGVKTTQMWTNKKTGERTRGEVIRKTELPAGFVIKI